MSMMDRFEPTNIARVIASMELANILTTIALNERFNGELRAHRLILERLIHYKKTKLSVDEVCNATVEFLTADLHAAPALKTKLRTMISGIVKTANDMGGLDLGGMNAAMDLDEEEAREETNGVPKKELTDDERQLREHNKASVANAYGGPGFYRCTIRKPGAPVMRGKTVLLTHDASRFIYLNASSPTVMMVMMGHSDDNEVIEVHQKAPDERAAKLTDTFNGFFPISVEKIKRSSLREWDNLFEAINVANEMFNAIEED